MPSPTMPRTWHCLHSLAKFPRCSHLLTFRFLIDIFWTDIGYKGNLCERKRGMDRGPLLYPPSVPPQQLYTSLLKQCLLDNIYGSHDLQWGKGNAPASADQVSNGNYWPARAHTMIGEKRLTNIEECFLDVVADKVEGDFIETGVWRGGATIFMAGLCAAHLATYGEKRKVYVADSFEGLPPPDPKYKHDIGDPHHTIKLLAIDLPTVQGNFAKYGLLSDQVVFVKGFFEHSLAKAEIGKLAILRLDGDMYSSTIQVLDQLYDKVSVGGYIIIDDYGALSNCRAAVDDFRRDRGITEEMKVVDWSGVYWRKAK